MECVIRQKKATPEMLTTDAVSLVLNMSKIPCTYGHGRARKKSFTTLYNAVKDREAGKNKLEVARIVHPASLRVKTSAAWEDLRGYGYQGKAA